MWILDEIQFGEEAEKAVEQYLLSIWYEVERTPWMAIHDFVIKKDNKIVSVELKTRRCSINTYPTTLIGANKLWEAWNRYYATWEETLFFFLFDDWLYYINPLSYIPDRQFKLQRFGRWIDKAKWWLYYNTNELIKIT